MARNPRSDGTKFAREIAAQLARPLPVPFLPLSLDAEKYWPRVVGAKLLSLWTDADLDCAWGLCEDLGKLEQFRLTLQVEPNFTIDEKGNIRQHPAFKLVEEVERRVQATKRHIAINATSTGGKADHQKTKNATGREIATSVAQADSDLIARPN